MSKHHTHAGPPGAQVALAIGLALAAALPGYLAAPAMAQQPRSAPQQNAEPPRGDAARPAEAGARPAARPANDNAPRLPADQTTEHSVELPGRTLSFKATAGAMPLNDAESGAVQAEI